MINKISDKDKKAWEDFLTENETLPNKDSSFIKDKTKKIQHIDLHGYSLNEANKKIEDFINFSFNEGVTKLIVVTGKGIHSKNDNNPYISKDLSILKYSVPEFIKNNVELMKKILEIKEASIEDGGSGAFYIFFKKK